MRLAFHYHVPAVQQNGSIWMPGFQGRFVDSLAQQCSQVTCLLHSPLPPERSIIDYRIVSPNVTLVDIGPHASVPVRLVLSHQSTRRLRDRIEQLDAVLLRGPSPLLPAMARAAGRLPVALLLVADPLAGIDDLPQPRWRKEAIRLFTLWNVWNQQRVAKHSLTFVNSRNLFDQLRSSVPTLVETRTTTLTENDFFVRSDTCASRPYHLLYTGRIVREKGLFDLVEALAILVSAGEDVVLDLVGWPGEQTILSELHAFAVERGVGERVIYHGYKPVGPELFAYYRSADIYVLASKSSEGFPRTIWEALAQSVPVVATRVGSIPYFLSGSETAVLVAPKNPGDLARAIQVLLHEPALRQKLIRQGRAVARQNTLEQRTKEMVTSIQAWVRDQ